MAPSETSEILINIAFKTHSKFVPINNPPVLGKESVGLTKEGIDEMKMNSLSRDRE